MAVHDDADDCIYQRKADADSSSIQHGVWKSYGMHPRNLVHPNQGYFGRFCDCNWQRRPEKLRCTLQLSREHQRGGGKKTGGAKPGDPRRKTVSDLPTSVRFATSPPPYSISLLSNSLQDFPQVTSERAFGGSPKVASSGPSSRGFAFWYVLLPPPLALPRQ